MGLREREGPVWGTCCSSPHHALQPSATHAIAFFEFSVATLPMTIV
ncbi:hypothetical protein ACPOL_0523 [Acidisarcina polymorpha]|uniref:Uncharacterized protein n=1 Tax=Acidisarcina polymorpha TaxID=2211140 RepID=A0A2Z5FSU0_9BACT|nr:hypothetical protein ACPOL_0523 [Acidisarcina polymorpha]